GQKRRDLSGKDGPIIAPPERPDADAAIADRAGRLVVGATVVNAVDEQVHVSAAPHAAADDVVGIRGEGRGADLDRPAGRGARVGAETYRERARIVEAEPPPFPVPRKVA